MENMAQALTKDKGVNLPFRAKYTFVKLLSVYYNESITQDDGLSQTKGATKRQRLTCVNSISSVYPESKLCLYLKFQFKCFIVKDCNLFMTGMLK